MRSSSPKKKVLIIGSLPPPYHGCNVFVENLLRSDLSRRFDLIHLDTSDRRNLENISRFDLTNVRLAFRHLFSLITVCVKHHPGLAHLSISQNTLGYLRDGLFIILITLFSRANIIIHLHGSYFKDFYESTTWIMRRFVDATMRRVSRAIVLGERLKPIFYRWLPDSRIDVVPNGSPLLPYLNGKFNRDNRRALRVIYLGNLFKFKGVLDIISAAAIVLKKHPSTRFLFAGNWGRDPVYNQTLEHMRAECYASIQQTGMQERFEFVGELNGRALEDYLVEGDIFVFPSIVEGMPLVILEAMSAGNPVISTQDVGAIPEMIQHGETGILIEKQNPEVLANAIIGLIENPSLRQRLGRAARQRFEEFYTTAKNIENLARVFEKALTDYTE